MAVPIVIQGAMVIRGCMILKILKLKKFDWIIETNTSKKAHFMHVRHKSNDRSRTPKYEKSIIMEWGIRFIKGEYFYALLDKLFPNVKEKYRNHYGFQYGSNNPN